MEHSKKINLEYLSQHQPEVINEIHRILREDGICEKSYARTFCLCFNQICAAEDRVSFSPGNNTWQVGSRHMSDAKILVSLSQVCELIHEQVLAEWNDSLFSAWIDSSELERIEVAMDSMESLNKLKAILQEAGKLMATDGSFSPAPGRPPAPAPAPARPQPAPAPQTTPQTAPPAPRTSAPASGKKSSGGAPTINWDKKG